MVYQNNKYNLYEKKLFVLGTVIDETDVPC